MVRSNSFITSIVFALSCIPCYAVGWLVNPNPDRIERVVNIDGIWRSVALPPLQAVSVGKLVDSRFKPLTSSSTKAGETIRGDWFAWHISTSRGVGAEINGKAVPFKMNIPSNCVIQMVGKTNLAVSYQLKSGDNFDWRLTFTADGAVWLNGKGSVNIIGNTDCAMWCYNPYGGLGLAKSRGSHSTHFHGWSGVDTRQLYAVNFFSGETTAIGCDDDKDIILIRPESPESTLRCNVAKASVAIGDNKLSTLYSFKLATTAKAARADCVNSQPPFLVKGDNGRLKALLPWSGWNMDIEDRNGDGPDFKNDVWCIDENGKFRGKVVFDKRDGEARADFFKDVNKDGVLTGAENDMPAVRLLDWDGDGAFFEGPIFYGGLIQRDKSLMQTGMPDAKWDSSCEQYDLDGDGDWDINRYGLDMHFDYYDRDIGNSFRPGFFDVVKHSQFDKIDVPEVRELLWSLITYASGARVWVAGLRDGSYFHYGETHSSHELDEKDPQPEAKWRVVAGGNLYDWHEKPSIIMSRMTMGNLDGKPREYGYDWDIQVSSTRESQQGPDLGEGIHKERLNVYKDAYGHVLKVRSPVLPSGDWDGKKLPLRKYKDGWDNLDSCPWNLMATWKYPKMYCVFAPEEDEGEVANEGFHQWVLHRKMKRRWEVNPDGTDGKTPLTLYYSPLFGGLHYKGAKWSHVNAPKTRVDLTPGREGKDGTPLTMPNARAGGYFGDSHQLRLWGDFFLSARDTDDDGYFDLYHWDKENDGVPDRILWYDARTKKVRVWEKNHLAEWPLDVKFEDVEYLLDQYPKICELYQKGLNVEPYIQRVGFNSRGWPLIDGKPVPNANVLDESRMPVAAVDSYYSKIPEPWRRFQPNGLLRFASVLAEEGYRLRTLDKPFSSDLLGKINLLVLPGFESIPRQQEWQALIAWVRKGGKVIVTNTSESGDSALITDTLLADLGVGLAKEPLDKLCIPWRQSNFGAQGIGQQRISTPDNRIQNFTSSLDGLLTGFEYLSFKGRPLKLKKGAESVLNYMGTSIVASAQVGKGQIMVSDANWFANDTLFHPHGVQTEGNVSNLALVENLLAYLMDRPLRKRSALTVLPGREYADLGECPKDFKAVDASNGLLAIKVFPELGGRMMFFGKPGQANQLQTFPYRSVKVDYQKINPAPPGFNPPISICGGLRDLPPSPFLNTNGPWLFPYQATSDDNSIEVESILDDIQYKRKMELIPDRSELKITASQTNVADSPQLLNLRINPSFAVGGGASHSDILIYPEKGNPDKIEKNAYPRGGIEKPTFASVAKGWAAVCDNANENTLVFRFSPREYTGSYYWLAEYNNFPNVPDKPIWEMRPTDGYYTFELLSKPKHAKPGESITRQCRWQLFTGIRDIDGVGEDMILDIAPQFDVVARGDVIHCPITIAAAGRLEKLSGTIKIDGKLIRTFVVPELEPGVASTIDIELPIDQEDGEYSISVEVDKNGAAMVKGSVPVIVRSNDFRKLRAKLDDIEDSLRGRGKSIASDIAKKYANLANEHLKNHRLNDAEQYVRKLDELYSREN